MRIIPRTTADLAKFLKGMSGNRDLMLDAVLEDPDVIGKLQDCAAVLMRAADDEASRARGVDSDLLERAERVAARVCLHVGRRTPSRGCRACHTTILEAMRTIVLVHAAGEAGTRGTE